MPPNQAKLALNNYLDTLTSSDEPDLANDLALASRLLENANSLLIEEQVELPSPLSQEKSPHQLNDLRIKPIESKEIANSVETVSIEAPLINEVDVAEPKKEIQVQADADNEKPLRQKLPGRFQALFFEVAGLTLAIPLVELGGIIQMQELSRLPAKPDWFMGVLVKQQDKYQCVDTARWIMPEKYTQEMAESLNYTYLIQLGKTPWSLACEHLATTHELSHDDIKWREIGGKRPWLAGMIKQKMCALVDASQVIKLLESKPTKNASSVVTE